MTPVELSRTVLRAVRSAVEGGELSVVVPERAVVTVPGPGGCGDYATNIALQLARPAGETPRRVAELLRSHLAGDHGVSGVEITGPGFLNITLKDTASAALVEEILRRGPRYGHLAGSAEPLVHLHAPHEVRAVVRMDATARILRSQGSLVRTSCEARPEPEWTDILGVSIDAYGTPESGVDVGIGIGIGIGMDVDIDIHARPVPADFTPSPSSASSASSSPSAPPAAPLRLGRDAARWALLHPAAHDRVRLTAEHLVQREANPLFRVRYAHARTRALSRNAADLGFTASPGDVQEAQEAQQAQQVQGAQERQWDAAPLLTALADHPRVLARAAAHRAPDLLARHLVAVADAVLPVLAVTLPLGDEKPLATHRARLALAEAAGTVLAGGLSLLGIDAPEHL